MRDNTRTPDFMAFMGHRLSPEIRQLGYEACKAMGLDSAQAHECTEKAAKRTPIHAD